MTTNETAWTMPALDTTYHLEDGKEITLGQMLDGIDSDMTPTDEQMLQDLLWAFGGWEDLEEMGEAVRGRTYEPGLTGKVGFHLV